MEQKWLHFILRWNVVTLIFLIIQGSSETYNFFKIIFFSDPTNPVLTENLYTHWERERERERVCACVTLSEWVSEWGTGEKKLQRQDKERKTVAKKAEPQFMFGAELKRATWKCLPEINRLGLFWSKITLILNLDGIDPPLNRDSLQCFQSWVVSNLRLS